MQTRTILGLTFALLVSTAWGFGTSGCFLFPDECIIIHKNGNDWCTQIIDAKMWPIGQPELAEVVVDESNEVPKGCACFNVDEEKILDDKSPQSEYNVKVAEIENAARSECAYIVPPGWEHNCYDWSDGGPHFIPVGRSGPGSCVGECSVSCRDEQPSPYECEEIVNGGDGGTDGGTEESDSSTGGPAFEPNREGELQWPQ